MTLRLLFLLTFLSSGASTFASTNTLILVKEYQQQDTEMYFFEKYNPYLALPEIEEERFLCHSTRLKPKVVYSSGRTKSAISVRKPLAAGFRYLKNNQAVDLKLASHLIAFPFQSFP